MAIYWVVRTLQEQSYDLYSHSGEQWSMFLEALPTIALKGVNPYDLNNAQQTKGPLQKRLRSFFVATISEISLRDRTKNRMSNFHA